MACTVPPRTERIRVNLSDCNVLAHFSTSVFLDGEVVYMLMDEGAA